MNITDKDTIQKAIEIRLKELEPIWKERKEKGLKKRRLANTLKKNKKHPGKSNQDKGNRR